jgi:alginate O-acetyltransferase complex protein AlgI
MVIADNLKDQTFWIAYPYFERLSSFTLITMLLGYSAQIFADFAGYSLIALGLAALFGYQLPKNFNFPYIATSFSDFWKRWHMSLSSFLREYLYIPLGGNRKGEVRTYLNLMLTMVIGGLWHGAAWSYAVWGAFHGLALVTERFFGNYIKVRNTLWTRWCRRLGVFIFVSLAWLLFKLPDFSHVVFYVRALCHNWSVPHNLQIISYIFIYSIPVALYHLFYLKKPAWQPVLFNRYAYVFYGIMLFLLITNAGSPGTFIYFQF